MINPIQRTQPFVDTTESGNSCECTRSRRAFIKLALVAGAAFSFDAAAASEPAEVNARPKAGDRFVFAEPDHEGIEIKPADLSIGGPQIQAWPMDSLSKTVRNGSRLNRVLLVRFEPSGLDEETRAHAADGIVAYSSVCTHAQCFVTGWNQEQQVLHCPCHQSDYDPRHNAKVVAGPAPRALPALPLKIVDGALTAMGPFLGRVGTRPS
jgi:rieske iron-sulfur protein